MFSRGHSLSQQLRGPILVAEARGPPAAPERGPADGAHAGRPVLLPASSRLPCPSPPSKAEKLGYAAETQHTQRREPDSVPAPGDTKQPWVPAGPRASCCQVLRQPESPRWFLVAYAKQKHLLHTSRRLRHGTFRFLIEYAAAWPIWGTGRAAGVGVRGRVLRQFLPSGLEPSVPSPICSSQAPRQGPGGQTGARRSAGRWAQPSARAAPRGRRWRRCWSPHPWPVLPGPMGGSPLPPSPTPSTCHANVNVPNALVSSSEGAP